MIFSISLSNIFFFFLLVINQRKSYAIFKNIMCCRTVTRFGCFFILKFSLALHTHTNQFVFISQILEFLRSLFLYQCKNRIIIFCSFVVLFLINAEKMHDFLTIIILTHSRCPHLFSLSNVLFLIFLSYNSSFWAFSSRCVRASSFLSLLLFLHRYLKKTIFTYCILSTFMR